MAVTLGSGNQCDNPMSYRQQVARQRVRIAGEIQRIVFGREQQDARESSSTILQQVERWIEDVLKHCYDRELEFSVCSIECTTATPSSTPQEKRGRFSRKCSGESQKKFSAANSQRKRTRLPKTTLGRINQYGDSQLALSHLGVG